MSNAKHTPGPWGLQLVNGKDQSYVCLVPEINIKNGDGKNYIGRINSAVEDGDAQANARLISAAPEMLVALEKALPLIQVYEEGPWAEAEKLIENALKKAKGE